VTVQPPDLVDSTHTLCKGLGQPPDSLTPVLASFTIAAATQVDMDEGKSVGVSVAAGALVQDQSAKLVSRQQEVAAVAIAVSEYTFQEVKCHWIVPFISRIRVKYANCNGL
jgi:hypothetical protein